MNRLGIMADVSHLSDSAFYDVLQASKAPIIASHSACRKFTPGFERNMDDTMIRALAGAGGVIQISFGSTFIDNDIRLEEEMRQRTMEHARKSGEAMEPRRYATVSAVADHIDHVVRLVGVDYVGLGSDFEGVGDTLPVGLKDASGYPNLLEELVKRGYSREDLGKICSGNLLRVWKAVERVARELRGK
jgi:membrane dipeptidase